MTVHRRGRSGLEIVPIKSKAQRRKFAELLIRGEITPETFERWNREAGSAGLPERLHPKAQKSRVLEQASVEGRRGDGLRGCPCRRMT
jgi:hypothetical protein